MNKEEVVEEALKALAGDNEDRKVPVAKSTNMVSERKLREVIGVANLKLKTLYNSRYKIVAEWSLDDKGEGSYKFVPLEKNIFGRYKYVYFAKYSDGSMKKMKTRDAYGSTETIINYIRDWEASRNPEKFGRIE
jgi:hypothetical protein